MQDMKAIIYKEAPPPGTLGKAELYSIALGYVVGAGIVSLIGPALMQTGKTVAGVYAVAFLAQTVNMGLFGVDLMAKVQKTMTWIMLSEFLLFFIMGTLKINQPVFDITAPGFF